VLWVRAKRRRRHAQGKRTIRDAETAELEGGGTAASSSSRQVLRQEKLGKCLDAVAAVVQPFDRPPGQSSLHHWIGNIARIHNPVQPSVIRLRFRASYSTRRLQARTSMLTLADGVRIA
jgi:hypothetical protein